VWVGYRQGVGSACSWRATHAFTFVRRKCCNQRNPPAGEGGAYAAAPARPNRVSWLRAACWLCGHGAARTGGEGAAATAAGSPVELRPAKPLSMLKKQVCVCARAGGPLCGTASCGHALPSSPSAPFPSPWCLVGRLLCKPGPPPPLPPPCPALPCPALPCPALPCPPQLPCPITVPGSFTVFRPPLTVKVKVPPEANAMEGVPQFELCFAVGALPRCVCVHLSSSLCPLCLSTPPHKPSPPPITRSIAQRALAGTRPLHRPPLCPSLLAAAGHAVMRHRAPCPSALARRCLTPTSLPSLAHVCPRPRPDPTCSSVTKTVPRYGFLSLDLKKSSHLSVSLGAKGFRDSPTITSRYTGMTARSVHACPAPPTTGFLRRRSQREPVCAAGVSVRCIFWGEGMADCLRPT
jgi:hypothetical protein